MSVAAEKVKNASSCMKSTVRLRQKFNTYQAAMCRSWPRGLLQINRHAAVVYDIRRYFVAELLTYKYLFTNSRRTCSMPGCRGL